MDAYCIDAGVIGTKKHFVHANGAYVWSDDVPVDCWHLTNGIKPLHDRCINTLAALGNIELDLLPPQRFVTALNAVLRSTPCHSIPWKDALPTKAFRAFVEGIIAQVEVTISSGPIAYVSDTWVHGTAVLRSLGRAKVDRARLASLIAAREGNVPALESFVPDDAGYARPTVYDRMTTCTGRLTIASGPSILTLKREHRSIIVPSAPGRSVEIIDFNALEPRVLLYEAGGRCDDVDLYASLSESMGGASRKVIKAIVLAELYGSSRAALEESIVGHDVDLDVLIKNVKNMFKTKRLLRRIKAKYVKEGKLLNRHGRPLFVDNPQDHVFINYYAQSTGVDVALSGFRNIIDSLRVTAPSAVPIFLLHDGLFVDIANDERPALRALSSTKVAGYVQRFTFKQETLVEH